MKNYLLWEKSGPMATFHLLFSWVGLALGWGVRRFHNVFTCFPTQQNLVHRTHPTIYMLLVCFVNT